MTSDGLHAVAIGDVPPRPVLVSRPTTDVAFGIGVPITGGAPDLTNGYLTSDCARLYLVGLGSVFYAQQL